MKPFVFVAGLVLALPVSAQVGIGPQPAPLPPPIPAPRDVAFAGPMRLAVDARDTDHKVFAVHESIPVQAPGPMVLLYPEWETGSHAASVSVADLAGLVVRAGGQRLAWRRDAVDVHAFHIAVPPGIATLEVDFQYVSPAPLRGGIVAMAPDLVNVPWQNLVLYPAGWFARDIPVEARLTLPAGFQYGSSLEPAGEAGGAVAFRPVSLETLVDSPVYAGRYVKRVELRTEAAAPVRFDLFADSAEGLAVAPGQWEKYRALIHQAQRLFGSRHYRHYDFLVSLSERFAQDGGIEHLQSSENNLAPDFFASGDRHVLAQDLIAHEYVHSWNGRFRQPADLWTPNFNVPMRGSLLWVYEGQTEFWGRVLAGRAGLRTRQQTLDVLAMDAALMQARAGRSWKSLQDSNNDTLFDIHRSVPWRDWQRREDYYPEGVLLWLDVDTLLRERSGGAKGLDDFARAFFGIHDQSEVTVTYTFEDVCAALNRLVPFDWAGFLRKRLDAHDADGLLDGIVRGGYRLVFTDAPSEAFRQGEEEGGAIDLSYSIGLTVARDGLVRSVAWNGPGFRAGLGVGARIVSVNGHAYDDAGLLAAVKSAAAVPVALTFSLDGRTRTVSLDYHGSLRYPRLERIAGTPDRLGALLAPRD